MLERAVGPSTPNNPNLFVRLFSQASDWRNLRQRTAPFVVAAAIVAVSMLLGDLLLLGISPTERISRLERWLYAYGLGMTAASLIAQALGLAGCLHRWTLAAPAAVIVGLWIRRRGKRPSSPIEWNRGSLVVLVAAPFVALAALGAALPTTDYDALAYHLLGPKEYFLEGRIRFLSHNVYTAFPFLTEMFPLMGMTLTDDWLAGAWAGQIVLFTFGPAAGAAVWVLGERLFGPPAGWWGAAVYLTTPWIYRISTIPYVEGASLCMTAIGVAAALRVAGDVRWSVIAGVLAGATVGCKYTGVLFGAAPIAAIVLFSAQGRFTQRSALFLAGVLAAAGPWLIRNWLWTGNPVFPLLYGSLGGRDWTSELSAAFDRAHRSTHFSRADAFWFLQDVAYRNDWQTALAFSFAPLALLGGRRRAAGWLWALTFYLFSAFYFATHRLDRFWLPLEPFVAVLAGAGMTFSRRLAWRCFVGAVFALTWIYNLAYVGSGLCGLANYNADLHRQWEANQRIASPAVAVANDARLVPRDHSVLYVGYAGVFDSLPRAVYSTVFNLNRFEQLVGEPNGGGLRPIEEVRSRLAAEDVGAVVVDWSWIERYRSPGNYGYCPFVQPSVFEELCAKGVLRKETLPPTLSRGGKIELYLVDRQGSRP